jgi:Ca-activated chloride channel homolog
MVSFQTPAPRRPLLALVMALLAIAAALTPLHGQQNPADELYRFKSGVELVNVTATVTDSSGRFVPDLTADDFIVYEDDVEQSVSQFSAERVPVSLGIALDTSGSMAGEKIDAARSALNRFLFDLLSRDDEIFLYRFNDRPTLLQEWTTDRQFLGSALGRIVPNGGTAMYDTVLEALPMTRSGRHAKKALLLISDGNDTSSMASIAQVKQRVRQTEVLVYAIGIDGDSMPVLPRGPIRRPQPRRPPMGPRMPFPGGPRRPWGFPNLAPQVFGPNRGWPNQMGDDRVNVGALREMTDESGGRTEIVRQPMDLAPATAGIADELSKQYYLGYTSTNPVRDGRWRSIRVELRDHTHRVRARRGYTAN